MWHRTSHSSQRCWWRSPCREVPGTRCLKIDAQCHGWTTADSARPAFHCLVFASKWPLKDETHVVASLCYLSRWTIYNRWSGHAERYRDIYHTDDIAVGRRVWRSVTERSTLVDGAGSTAEVVDIGGSAGAWGSARRRLTAHSRQQGPSTLVRDSQPRCAEGTGSGLTRVVWTRGVLFDWWLYCVTVYCFDCDWFWVVIVRGLHCVNYCESWTLSEGAWTCI